MAVACGRCPDHCNAAGGLREAWEAHSARLYRNAPVPAEFLRRRVADGAFAACSLADALAPLLRETPVPDTSHLADLAVSLVKELRRLRLILDDEGEFTFAAVAPRDRLERAVTFFALLELHSSGEARLRQTRHFGDIVVSRITAPAPVTGGRRPPSCGSIDSSRRTTPFRHVATRTAPRSAPLHLTASHRSPKAGRGMRLH